jgi:hypothetical protein
MCEAGDRPAKGPHNAGSRNMGAAKDTRNPVSDESEAEETGNAESPSPPRSMRILDRSEAERLFGLGELEWSGLERHGGVLTIRLVFRSGDTLRLCYDPVRREKRFEAWPAPALPAGS